MTADALRWEPEVKARSSCALGLETAIAANATVARIRGRLGVMTTFLYAGLDASAWQMGTLLSNTFLTLLGCCDTARWTRPYLVQPTIG